MRAIGIAATGGYEVLSVIDRSAREPGPGEVRIAVRAAAVSATDGLLRIKGAGDLPAPWTPGMDAAGTIEAVGEGVERLHVGQAVMAAVTPRRPEGGAQAELLVAPAAAVVAIPDGASFQQAATLPMNGLTAKLGLEVLGLRAGQTLGVTGGAGLLASYVIPLAREMGVRVIADAKPGEERLVRGFGADIVVARGERFVSAVREAVPDGVDGLYDTAMLHDSVFGAIRDRGIMVVVRGWKPDRTEREIKVKQILVDTVLERTDWLEELRRLASEHRLQLRVAGEYPPERAGEAQRATDAGGLRGRIVIVF